MHPFGRKKFTLNPTINQNTGKIKDNSLFVTFTACKKGQFTCSSGHCVDIKAKCDSIMDCEDGSDEEHCPVFIVPDTYKLRASPNGSPLKVYASIIIQSFPVIETVELTFSVNYYLALRW